MTTWHQPSCLGHQCWRWLPTFVLFLLQLYHYSHSAFGPHADLIGKLLSFESFLSFLNERVACLVCQPFLSSLPIYFWRDGLLTRPISRQHHCPRVKCPVLSPYQYSPTVSSSSFHAPYHYLPAAFARISVFVRNSPAEVQHQRFEGPFWIDRHSNSMDACAGQSESN